MKIIFPTYVLFTKHVFHDKWCKYMYSGECCGRVQTIVLDMVRFVKSCVSTLNWPRVFQGEGRVYSSPPVFIVIYLSRGMAAKSRNIRGQ